MDQHHHMFCACGGLPAGHCDSMRQACLTMGKRGLQLNGLPTDDSREPLMQTFKEEWDKLQKLAGRLPDDEVRRAVKELFEKCSTSGGRGQPVVTTVSLKDFCTTREMVKGIVRWINGDYTGLIKAKEMWGNRTSVTETLWETALKLRQHRSEADEAMASNLLTALDHFLSGPAWLTDPSIDNFVCRVKADVDFLYNVHAYLISAQLSCSVLMELCRYRRGCLALAESPVFSKLLFRGYMAHILTMASAYVVGGIKILGRGLGSHPLQWSSRLLQANLDAIGRCLSSMPPGATRARAGRQVAEWLDDEKIEESVEFTSKVTDVWCAKGIWNIPIGSTRPIDQLKVAVAQLTTLAEACQEGRCHPPFKVQYVMEAGDLETRLPTGMVEDITARDCVWCGKIGRTRRCSRCKSAWYCGTTCQRKDWEDGHKDDCTTFQVDNALADIRQVVRATRQTEDNAHRKVADRTVGMDHDAQIEASASAAQIAPQAAMGVPAETRAPKDTKSTRRRRRKKSRKAARDEKAWSSQIVASQAIRDEAPSEYATAGGLPLEESGCPNRDDHAAVESVDEDADCCAICLDPFSASEPRQGLETCTHGFHDMCLCEWRAACEKKGWTWGCPLCRQG